MKAKIPSAIVLVLATMFAVVAPGEARGRGGPVPGHHRFDGHRPGFVRMSPFFWGPAYPFYPYPPGYVYLPPPPVVVIRVK